jgi:virginiamycin B lyase
VSRASPAPKTHFAKENVMRRLLALGLLTLALPAQALSVRVVDAQGKPLTSVMVSLTPQEAAKVDTSDNGYAQSGKPQRAIFESHRFTNGQGQVDLPESAVPWKLRLRKPGFQDVLIDAKDFKGKALTLPLETDPLALAAQKPSNVWTSTVDFGDENLKKEWLLQCNFCHQQGSGFLRRDRTKDEWDAVVKRMVRYGARLSTDGQKKIPELISAHWQKINANPALLPDATPWAGNLSEFSIRELPIGDTFSQMHDLLRHSNGLIYVGDNLQDRVYEINPATGEYTVYKVPPFGSPHGGLLAGRLVDFPKHETFQGIHSLAESPKDGHIFITPSYQRRLVEFDPTTKQFSIHSMDQGFYPHTIRFDDKDRAWFTLALSNQIAMFDRAANKFSYYDLPYRSVGERITTWLMPTLFKLMSWGVPLANWAPIDHQSTGVTLPYGIDTAPDGTVWFARLHTDEIGKIDPTTGQVTLIKTDFKAPRRLRADRDGKIWMVAFNESQIVRYDPLTGSFTRFDLPVIPLGSDTPYSLNVDKPRHQVWVNGTNSDSIYRFDIRTSTWSMIPMSRKSTFTRDVEFSSDGKVYVTGAAFPSWHIEDGQPTLMEITVNRKN